MTMPNTPYGDVTEWQLGQRQAEHYYRRLRRYHSRQVVYHAARAVAYAKQAERAAWVAAACIGFSLLMLLLGWVTA